MVFEHALWVQKSHLGSRRGYHGAFLGGLGGYLGARWGQLVPCGSHLEVMLGELGGYLAPPWVHKSGEVEIVDFSKVLQKVFEHALCVQKSHLGSRRGSLGETLVILGATLGLCCATLGNLEGILEEFGRHSGQP